MLKTQFEEAQESFGYKNQRTMFDYIWRNRPHICYVTGTPISRFYASARRYNLFAHVLAKGKYPLYKLNPENIVLLHPDIHTLFDQGTKQQREDAKKKFGKCDWILLYALAEEMKGRYEIFRTEVMG